MSLQHTGNKIHNESKQTLQFKRNALCASWAGWDHVVENWFVGVVQ